MGMWVMGCRKTDLTGLRLPQWNIPKNHCDYCGLGREKVLKPTSKILLDSDLEPQHLSTVSVLSVALPPVKPPPTHLHWTLWNFSQSGCPRRHVSSVVAAVTGAFMRYGKSCKAENRQRERGRETQNRKRGRDSIKINSKKKQLKKGESMTVKGRRKGEGWEIDREKEWEHSSFNTSLCF